jgi:hypothetical protein
MIHLSLAAGPIGQCLMDIGKRSAAMINAKSQMKNGKWLSLNRR